MTRLLLHFSLFFSILATTFSATESRQNAHLEQIVQNHIIVDGKLSEPIYLQDKWQSGFRTLSTHGKTPHQTSFRLFTDSEYIYLAARLEENGEAVANHKNNGDPLWRDDSLQLFLACSDDEAAFFQIIINPAGAVATIEYAQAGLVSSYDWSPKIKSGVALENGAWTVELAIPIADLKITPSLKEWKLQVGRSRVARGEEKGATSSWQLADRLPSPAFFGTLRLPDFPRSIYGWEVKAYPAVIGQTKGDYFVRQRLSVINKTDRYANITLTSSLTTEENLSAQKKLGIPPGRSETVWTETPLGKEGHYEGAIEHQLALSRNPAQRLASEKQALDLQYEAVKLILKSPGYRSVIFSSQNLSFIEAILKPIDESLEIANLSTSLTTPDGQNIAGDVAHDGNKWKILFKDIKDLPEGTHTLNVRYTQDGEEAQVNREIRKLPYRPYETWIDERGIVYRAGEPLPIYGFAFGHWHRTSEMLLPSMFYNFAGPVWATPPFKAMEKTVSELAQHGILSGLYIPTASSSPRSGLQDTPLTESERNEYLALIQAAGENPSIFAYYQLDEPELNAIGVRRLQEIYEFFVKHDPYRPLIITNHGARAIRDYQLATDISSPDPYPGFRVGLPPFRPSERQGMHLEQAVIGEESYKALWQMPQAYNTAFYGATGARGPSAREMRTQQINGIIHGATGFSWYNQYMLWDEPGVFTSLPYLSQEYKVLFKLIVNAKVHKLEGDPNRESKAIIADGDTIKALLICNLSWSDDEITLRDPRLRTVSEWKLSGSTRIIEGGQKSVSIKLKPFEGAVLLAPEVNLQNGLDWAAVEAKEADLRSHLVVPGNIAHFSAGTKASQFNFTQKNSSFALMAIDGMKHPKGTGALLKGFQPGAGIELDFNRQVTPKRLELIGSKIEEGHIELQQADEWIVVASIPPNDNELRIIDLPGKETSKLRIKAQSIGKAKEFSLREVEVYED